MWAAGCVLTRDRCHLGFGPPSHRIDQKSEPVGQRPRPGEQEQRPQTAEHRTEDDRDHLTRAAGRGEHLVLSPVLTRHRDLAGNTRAEHQCRETTDHQHNPADQQQHAAHGSQEADNAGSAERLDGYAGEETREQRHTDEGEHRSHPQQRERARQARSAGQPIAHSHESRHSDECADHDPHPAVLGNRTLVADSFDRRYLARFERR